MTTPNLTFNPIVTTNAAGSFQIESTGYVQGTALDQPAVRFALSGGILATSETLPMWGGVGISENIASGVTSGIIPETGSSSVLGSSIIRATNVSAHTSGQLTGFSVFDQNYSAVNSPQSPVPLTGTAMQVNFYRLGSGARIAVACDPALVSLDGSIITQQVSWDFVNQLLIPYTGTLTVNSTGSSYNNTTGLVTLKMTAPIGFSAGDAVIVSSLTGSSITSQNGTYTVVAVTASDTFTYQAAAGADATTITGGSVTLGSGSDVAIPVDVLDVNVGNSMTVSYNSTTGFATWNRSGSCAIILI